VSLLGELMWASDQGGIYKLSDEPGRRADAHRPIVALRNAVFHPAAVSAEDEDVPVMYALAEAIRERDRELAKYLLQSPDIREPRLAAWALRQLDVVGDVEHPGLRSKR
jgi:hypothetical protein